MKTRTEEVDHGEAHNLTNVIKHMGFAELSKARQPGHGLPSPFTLAVFRLTVLVAFLRFLSRSVRKSRRKERRPSRLPLDWVARKLWGREFVGNRLNLRCR